MRFLWPGAFFLLALIPTLIGVYLWLQKRRRRFAVRYASLSLIREALPEQSRLRRYLPLALFLVALTSLVFALSRPVTTTLVPDGQATIILALDVSGSMRQHDIYPSRLGAAKEAALSFIERQQSNNQIGIVAFAGFSQLIQAPTSDADDLEAAVRHLTTARGTAIGSGILEALESISAVNTSVAPVSDWTGMAGDTVSNESGGYVPDIIVLLTDGVYTTGPNPLDAAQQAVNRGVRVYTIGFGTQVGSNSFNQGGGNFWGMNRGIDEESLRQIAAMTGGEYFAASSANELNKVFADLPTYLITREETTEVSVVFAALAAALVLAAVMLSLLWHPMP